MANGLARVLATVAQERQVVVFTHDERLPKSVRRLQFPAHVIEVVRRLGSQVACRAIRDPVTQYLSDARALLRADDLPAGAAARAVPLFCRLAMEAACADAFRRRRIGRGEPHAGTDEMLNDARTLMPKLRSFCSMTPDGPGRCWPVSTAPTEAGPTPSDGRTAERTGPAPRRRTCRRWSARPNAWRAG